MSRDKITDILSESGLNYFQELGDFFLLYLIAKNMDEVATKELINELHSALRPAYSNAPTLKASSKNNSAIEWKSKYVGSCNQENDLKKVVEQILAFWSALCFLIMA